MSLREAIARFDLEEYLVDHVPEVTNEKERVIECPLCGKRKLTVNLEKRAWHCWTCQTTNENAKGGLLDLIQLLDGITRIQAKNRILLGFNGNVSLEELGALGFEAAVELLPNPTIKPPTYWKMVATSGILPYCVERGISQRDAEDFELMWCERGQYAGRLVFPVWEDRRLVYWQARAMWSKQQQLVGRYIKSLNPPKTRGTAGSSDVLFNLDRAKHYPRVVVTEGPIDAIHVGPEAVCTFGKKMSPVQVGLLLKAGVRAVDLMWDGPGPTEPKGAWPEMFRLAEQLRHCFDVRLVFLPRGDPGDYPRSELAWFRMNHSKPARAFQSLMEV